MKIKIILSEGIIYLGASFSTSSNQVQLWDPLIHKLSRKLAPWRSKLIDMAGQQRSRKLHLLGWEKICKPKAAGGLGLPAIQNRNFTLLIKWWWRCCVDHNSLRNQTLKAKYGDDVWFGLQKIDSSRADSFIMKSFLDSGKSCNFNSTISFV
ncbi:hypothetical protein POM88_020262 [Heracleum sosnowskyi]|uniref:Uncharacterized protein n=1 Tax=Heracleum sosnowskyi TaxID=360622 RepID=A0AAD8IDJ9_9APIA|nr:hypothetical protein POM88_020262 [Heracleum sosnowskyi]